MAVVKTRRRYFTYDHSPYPSSFTVKCNVKFRQSIWDLDYEIENCLYFLTKRMFMKRVVAF
jgi:hypothetical protein